MPAGKTIAMAAGSGRPSNNWLPFFNLQCGKTGIMLGDPLVGHNLLRRFLLAHHVPKIKGQPIDAPICAGTWGGMESEYHLQQIKDIRKHRLPCDCYWRAADASDRQGMTEIRYVEGHYQFWDDLLQRHPGLLIDNCASGGRRIDLETISRSIPL